jgi:hypothetical protein
VRPLGSNHSMQNTTANPLKDAERRQFDETNAWDKP